MLRSTAHGHGRQQATRSHRRYIRIRYNNPSSWCCYCHSSSWSSEPFFCHLLHPCLRCLEICIATNQKKQKLWYDMIWYAHHVTHRYAVKGLSGDSVDSVLLQEGDGTFEDDRRFALLYDEGEHFDENYPTWLHKENIFSAPSLHQSFSTHRIQSWFNWKKPVL